MKYTVKSAVAPLYQNASEAEPRIDEVLHGMEVEVSKREGRWLFAETDYKYRGWLACEHVAEAGFNGDPTPITGFSVDVLSAPSVKSVVVGNLTAGCVVNALENGEKYALIELADGARGYVMTKFLGKPIKRAENEADFRANVLETAESYLGSPYRWGGKSPRGIDCSGLCFMAYRLNGVTIYRDARIEEGFPVREIPLERLKVGDLLYFPGHVAICAGEGLFIHSSESNGGVYYNSLNDGDGDYRADLAESLTCCGSIF